MEEIGGETIWARRFVFGHLIHRCFYLNHLDSFAHNLIMVLHDELRDVIEDFSLSFLPVPIWFLQKISKVGV